MNNTSKARQLRRNSTEAEAMLWSHLRNRQLASFKFRRQSPIGPYIADFECYAAKLAVELDGGQHQSQLDYDNERTRYMVASGYHMLRFWNNDVIGDVDAVLEVILAALEARIGPSP